MKINDLYKVASEGNKAVEELLFEHLYVSFRLFLRQRVEDKIDSEEIVQSAVSKIAACYRDVEITKSFAAWAYMVLKNELLNYFRAKSAHRRRYEAADDNSESKPSAQSDPVLKSQLMECLRKINQVLPRHARIINLHYQGYSTEEICARMNITANNCYVLLSRARNLLKSCLKTGDVEK